MGSILPISFCCAMLPTLKEFITKYKNTNFPHNSYVREKGFSSLYVRIGLKYLGGKLIPCVLDIANVEVHRKGNGVFSALLARLHDEKISIYIECVHNKRLVEKLRRENFVEVNNTVPSFYRLKNSFTE